MLKPELITDQGYINNFHAKLGEKFKLHDAQLEIAKASARGKHVKVDCGRKFGKTVTAKYVTLRTAVLYRDAPIYIVAPKLKQAREIYHVKREIERMCPPGYIKRVYNQDMRYVFNSGSFIKIDGSDNPELHRGPDMFMLTVDEIKDCHPEMMPAIEPNILTMRGLMLLLGTPPDNDVTPEAKIYWAYSELAKHDPDWAYFRMPSSANPHNPKDALEKIKARLFANGDQDVWYREYEGIYVQGGKGYIFPTFDNEARGSKNIFPDNVILEKVRELFQKGEIELYCIADPGTARAFCQVFIAYHRRSGDIYQFAEIYETGQGDNSVRALTPIELEKMSLVQPDPFAWILRYDEAARWFQKERESAGTDYGWEPTQKYYMKAETGDLKPGLSLLKDVIRLGKYHVAESCENTISEIRNYSKNRLGVVAKRNDHAIDCLRYFLDSADYTLEGTESTGPLGSNLIKKELDIERQIASHSMGYDYDGIEEILHRWTEDFFD